MTKDGNEVPALDWNLSGDKRQPWRVDIQNTLFPFPSQRSAPRDFEGYRTNLACATRVPACSPAIASCAFLNRRPPQHAPELPNIGGMVSSLSGAWQRVRGHGLRQAIGALLFGTYTAILWRIYPESKFWPDAHNFQRRQWIEGCLWCAAGPPLRGWAGAMQVPTYMSQAYAAPIQTHACQRVC